MTPLTPPLRPPTATHPYFLQSSRCHALITRCLACHWSRSHTHLFFIGSMLPPASVLWILFSFFLLTCFTQLRLDLAGRGEVNSGCSSLEAGVHFSLFVSLCHAERNIVTHFLDITTPRGSKNQQNGNVIAGKDLSNCISVFCYLPLYHDFKSSLKFLKIKHLFKHKVRFQNWNDIRQTAFQ